MAVSDSHDLKSLLSTADRDFLLRNDGHQVKISDLCGKATGLYFSASWCGPCRGFTPKKLVQVYNYIRAKSDFEIVFLSEDEDEESFNRYFSEMPWLAIPFSDSETRDRLEELFEVNGIPHLVILDGDGRILNVNGVDMVREYVVEGHPFTEEIMKLLKEEEEKAKAKAKKGQRLRSILVSDSRDFLISNGGNRVPVSELEGKIVGLYFSRSLHFPCIEFTHRLLEVYVKSNEASGDESFKVVLISLDKDEDTFNQTFEGMSWLALPFHDKISRDKLVRHFEVSVVPTLVIIGQDGRTLQSNAVQLVEEHGVRSYPFTIEKIAELEEAEKVRREEQTLESILVSRDSDFVIQKDGSKVPVSGLVGKNILLFFAASWCSQCRAFLPKLIKAYHEIKAKDLEFEVIFISSDRGQAPFEEFFAAMPWLALPFIDDRKESLSRTFKVRGIPTVLAFGPNGRTVAEEAKELLVIHGADAYPFTPERLKEVAAKLEDMAKEWPEKVRCEFHGEHELLLSRCGNYVCDVCDEQGHGWSFSCEDCDYDLHPKCALAKGNEDAIEDVKLQESN